MDDDAPPLINPVVFDRASSLNLTEILIVAVVIGLGVAAWVLLGQRRLQATRAEVAGFFPRKRRRRRSRRS